MQPDAVVVAFDIAKTLASGFSDCLEYAAFDQFRLEPGKEALGLGVIVAVAPAAHRLSQPSLGEQPPVFARYVLRAPVRVDNGAAFYQPAS